MKIISINSFSLSDVKIIIFERSKDNRGRFTELIKH